MLSIHQTDEQEAFTGGDSFLRSDDYSAISPRSNEEAKLRPTASTFRKIDYFIVAKLADRR